MLVSSSAARPFPGVRSPGPVPQDTALSMSAKVVREKPWGALFSPRVGGKGQGGRACQGPPQTLAGQQLEAHPETSRLLSSASVSGLGSGIPTPDFTAPLWDTKSEASLCQFVKFHLGREETGEEGPASSG